MRHPVVLLEGPQIGILRVRLGNGPAKVVGGGATINEIARPELDSLSDFAGNPLKRVDLPVFFDGFRSETDVTQNFHVDGVEYAGVNNILALSEGGEKGQFPPWFEVRGAPGSATPIPYPRHRWLLELPDWLEGQRGMAGQLIRQELLLHLVQFNNPEADVPKRHRRQLTGIAQAKGLPRVVTLPRHMTVIEVAVHYFHDASRAKQIGQRNNIRDIRTVLPKGTKLRIPES